jgi:hypothetical protein
MVLGTGQIGYMYTTISNALPTMQMGWVARVDSVYGNDTTAYLGGLPFSTIQGAVNAVIGSGSVALPTNSNSTIWVLPGTYLVSPTGGTNTITDTCGNVTYACINLPYTTALRGLNIQTCKIVCSNPTSNTTLLKMGENCRVEDLTLTLGSNYTGSNNLVGIYYGGTTTVTSKLRTSVLNVCNAGMTYTASNNVFGIQFDGTGTLGANTFSFNCVKGSTINVYTNGAGIKRGMLVTNTNIVTTRDTNVYVAQPSVNAFTGTYVGVETADPAQTGSIQLRSTTVGTVGPTGVQQYTASDILQTSPTSIANPSYLASAGIQVGPGVDLVTKTAGGKGFSTYIYPTTLFYGCFGQMAAGQKYGWLWPGTMIFSASYPDQTTNASGLPAFYRVQQPLICMGMTVTCAISGTSNMTVTVCKNPTATTSAPKGQLLTGATATTVTIPAGSLIASFYNASVNFNTGDYLSVYMVATDNTWTDVSVQVDCF